MSPRRSTIAALAVTLVLLLGGAVTGPRSTTAAAPGSAVPRERLERLSRGASVTRWFWNPEGATWAPDHASAYITDEQLRAIRAAGFRHIRLPIEPASLVSVDHPGVLAPALLADLDAAIARVIAADLAVIVDPHGWKDAWQEALRTDPATQDAFVAMWSALAGHLAATDPGRVFLEVLNEPAFATAEWQPILDRTVAAMRAAAPEHTIVVGGGLWNGIDGLDGFVPPDDPDVVVNIHVYDPFLFTHQTAAWSGQMGYAMGIPYPNDRWNGCDHLPTFGHDLDGWVVGYCTTERWDAAALSDRTGIAAEWAVAHGDVPLTANEFGVMPTAPYRDRLTWIHDVRTAFEADHIGWTIWGWDDGFGLDTVAQGAMDAGVLQALGMTLGG